MLCFLLAKILQELAVLLLGSLEAVTGIVAEFFDELEPLDGLGLDLTVVALHRFEIAAEGVELRIKEAFEELHVLPFARVLVKQGRDVLDRSEPPKRGRDRLSTYVYSLPWCRLCDF